jgi:SP family sugar:H+ symporter-like MFS transporter
MFKNLFKKRTQDVYNESELPRESVSTADHEKGLDDTVDSPIPLFTLRSFIMGIFVSMGGFLFGYDTGQISGFLEMEDFLRRFGELNSDGTYYFSNVRSGLIVALVSCRSPHISFFSNINVVQLSIGTLIGALVAAPIADRVGRKWSISGWCVILMAGITVQISSPNHKWYQVALGRWTAGLGVGALSLLVPMYQAESGPRHIRGALVRYVQETELYWALDTNTLLAHTSCSSLSESSLRIASISVLKNALTLDPGESPWESRTSGPSSSAWECSSSPRVLATTTVTIKWNKP